MNTSVENEVMTTQDVAGKLVQLCRQGKNMDAINELYADHVISIEPKGSHAERTEGKAAVIGKNQQWFDMVEQVHSSEISEPVVTGNHFAVAMDMDVTLKGKGRSPMNEVCVYEVKDGKIVSDNFFYTINK
ncbi:MAG: nuclear transport factor 2 family protein [Bacteroidia bacterium]